MRSTIPAAAALAAVLAVAADRPLLSILSRFTAADVPALGPAEPAATPQTWPEPVILPARPGRGLAQHPMLYAGEGLNTLFVVNQGKVVWT